MLFSSQRLMFLVLLILGTLVALSSTSWFTAWMGLELNLMSFIPLISSKQNRLPSEAALKYFLVQALGSALIIFAAPLSLNFPIFFSSILIALLLKLGAAPFHFWFPAIMEGLNWTQAIVLMTIQKIAPMFLISHLAYSSYFFSILVTSASLSAIIGSIGGLNQTSLRKILAYSSINHMSWMLIAISISESSWLIYFSFYSIISTSIALLFNHYQSFYFSQLLSQKTSMPLLGLVSSLSLLSLGGLPPFSGFLPKWILIESMTNSKLFLPLIILILSSLVTLYYYLRLAISSLILLTTKPKSSLYSSPSSAFAPALIYTNLFLLFIPSFFTLF
uniref:NADH-ubiquinone oxidoreductase chain 2 n=1 Tax=Puerulus angulatus TaxID=198227 RepID=A0A411ATR8_9EUCA|nr:NADH dehydrogenase subunit 2 [Puerulus angulatus]QAX91412.1 NADH dehydrogenase subunit 2 [Puerulus angulatus]